MKKKRCILRKTKIPPKTSHKIPKLREFITIKPELKGILKAVL